MSDARREYYDAMRKLSSGEMRLKDLPQEALEQLLSRLMIDADVLQDHFDERREKDRDSPGAGTEAPDFRLELIDGKGTRTGNMVSLKECLDKPVALIFGSYT